jgi:hypothetical protein
LRRAGDDRLHPAVYNAVMDALAPLGVKKVDMRRSFDYHRPRSLAEATKRLGNLKDAKVLAGGHTACCRP